MLTWFQVVGGCSLCFWWSFPGGGGALVGEERAASQAADEEGTMVDAQSLLPLITEVLCQSEISGPLSDEQRKKFIILLMISVILLILHMEGSRNRHRALMK